MAVAHRRHLDPDNRAAHLKPRFSAAYRAGPQAPIPSHLQVLEGQSPALELRSLGYELTLVGTSLLNALMPLGRWGLIHGKSLFYIGGNRIREVHNLQIAFLGCSERERTRSKPQHL